MTQQILKNKLKQAINDIIDETDIRDTLTPETRRNLENGIDREADKKSQYLYEYINEYIYQRLSALENKVTILEQNMALLIAARGGSL